MFLYFEQKKTYDDHQYPTICVGKKLRYQLFHDYCVTSLYPDDNYYQETIKYNQRHLK